MLSSVLGRRKGSEGVITEPQQQQQPSLPSPIEQNKDAAHLSTQASYGPLLISYSTDSNMSNFDANASQDVASATSLATFENLEVNSAPSQPPPIQALLSPTSPTSASLPSPSVVSAALAVERACSAKDDTTTTGELATSSRSEPAASQTGEPAAKETTESTENSEHNISSSAASSSKNIIITTTTPTITPVTDFFPSATSYTYYRPRHRTFSVSSASTVLTVDTTPPRPLPANIHRFTTTFNENTPLLLHQPSFASYMDTTEEDHQDEGGGRRKGERSGVTSGAFFSAPNRRSGNDGTTSSSSSLSSSSSSLSSSSSFSRSEEDAGNEATYNGSSTYADQEEDAYSEERLPLSTIPLRKSTIAYWMDSMVRRFLILTLLPTLFILAWCAVPFPIYEEGSPHSDIPDRAARPKTNFLFFLVYYYGTFNLVSILLITSIFRLYSLDWYPKSLGGVASVAGFWLASETVGGSVIYFCLRPSIRRNVMTWVVLTLVTMSIPLFTAWWKIRKHRRHWVRRSLTVAQKIFAMPAQSGSSWAFARRSRPDFSHRDGGDLSPTTSSLTDSLLGPSSSSAPPSSSARPPPPNDDNLVIASGTMPPISSTRSISTSSAASLASADTSSTLSPTKISSASGARDDILNLPFSFHSDGSHGHNSYTPTSYTRFLWFLTSIGISLGSLLLSQLYAHIFLTTLPHSALANIIYIYSLTLTNLLMSSLCVTVTEQKIRSPPLSLAFRLYFGMIYFVFYRTLFARLRSVDQFVWVQLASSVGVVVLYPALMSRWSWRGLEYLSCTGGRAHDRWIRDVGRGFWIRNVAENATMMAFLGISTLLQYSPTTIRFYPYFQFNTPGDIYNYTNTLYCTLGIWASELLSSYLARLLFKRFFDLSITRQASREVKTFPEVVGVMGLIVVFVGMGMVLACCRMDFV